MFEKGYKNMYHIDCVIKPLFNKPDSYNTLVKNISNYIGYHNYANNQMSIIYNIDVNKLTSYFPIHYNTNYIKNVIVYVIDSKVHTLLYFGKEWDYVVKQVKETISNYSYERFLLNNSNFPNIEYYLNNKNLFNIV